MPVSAELIANAFLGLPLLPLAGLRVIVHAIFAHVSKRRTISQVDPNPRVGEPVLPAPEHILPTLPVPEAIPPLPEPIPLAPDPNLSIPDLDPSIPNPNPSIPDPNSSISDPRPPVGEPNPPIKKVVSTIEQSVTPGREPMLLDTEPVLPVVDSNPPLPEPNVPVEEVISPGLEFVPPVLEHIPPIQEPISPLPELIAEPILPPPEPISPVQVTPPVPEQMDLTITCVPEQRICPPFTLLSSNPENRIIKQREFHGRWCIPSEIADLKIDDPVVLLAKLDDIFGTTYSCRFTQEALGNVMNYCISRGYDLGMAYGMLRPWWASVSPLGLVSHFEMLEHRDRERRERAVCRGLVLDCHIPPRRVWDLYSNRVLPFWAVNVSWKSTVLCVHEIQAVSHAWMHCDARRDVITPINHNKWPVPIPEDISLDDLRIECLNLRVEGETEYVWLDVLCLRQMGGEPQEESLRAKEWGIDVSTIGAVYWHCVSTVFYLNGIGRPFEENDTESARHWCNRAWTMQEWSCGVYGTARLLGGLTEQSPRFSIASPYSFGNPYTKRLCEKMSWSDALIARTNIIVAAAMMSGRQAERELDKLAGLAYFACGDTQPVFDATQDVQDAWLPFIDCLTFMARGQLFFVFPVAGDGKYKWAPSWDQLLREAEELKTDDSDMYDTWMYDKHCPTLFDNGYSCLAVCLPICRLNKFASSPPVTDPNSLRKECGITQCTVTFKLPETDNEITFYSTARHSYPISSDRTYCLLSSGLPVGGPEVARGSCCYHWAVGFLDEQERFHKETVLEFNDVNSDDVAVKTRHALIKVLGLFEEDNDEANSWIRRVELA